jgi:hypothetical protein
MKGITALLGLVAAGCASSGIVPTGPDSYMIAKNEWGMTSGSVHKARLMQDAADFCRGMGKQMVVTSTNQNDVSFGKTPGAEVQFRCVQGDAVPH